MTNGDNRSDSALVEAIDVTKQYKKSSGAWGGATGLTQAVDHVTLTIERSQSLAVVGESGCGKSSLARLLAGLERPTTGLVKHGGSNLWELGKSQRRLLQRRTQIVFQDPDSAINPRWTVRQTVSEPLRIHGCYEPSSNQIERLLEKVGLNSSHLRRYPHQLSGGQKQRVNIARALALEPALLILDEPVSALDLSIQAQILNLLRELRDELGLAFVFVSHDLGVVRQICEQIVVMYVGQVVEAGSTSEVLSQPFHPYTQTLIESAPVWHPSERRDRRIIVGEVPDPSNPPSGCRFRTRCFKATSACAEVAPALSPDDGHSVACLFPLNNGDGL